MSKKVKGTLILEGADLDLLIDEDTLNKYYNGDIRQWFEVLVEEDGLFSLIDFFKVTLGEFEVE